MKKLLLGLCLVVVVVGNQTLPRRYAAEVAQPTPVVRSRADVMLDVLGEARSVLARFLWFKMDLLHEELDRGGVNVFKQADVMPLLRIITLLDHRLDDAYDIMVTDLHWGQHRSEQALELLDEGLAYNPKSLLLLFRKARICLETDRNAEVLPLVDQALTLGPDPLTTRNFCRLGFHAARRLKEVSKAEHYLRLMYAAEPGDPTAGPLWKQLHGTDPPRSVQFPSR